MGGGREECEESSAEAEIKPRRGVPKLTYFSAEKEIKDLVMK